MVTHQILKSTFIGILLAGMCSCSTRLHLKNSINAQEHLLWPRITRIFTVRGDILAIQIEAGSVVAGQQVQYQYQRGDRLTTNSRGTWLERGGIGFGPWPGVAPMGVTIGGVTIGAATIGRLLEPDHQILYSFDQQVGQPLNTDWTDRPQSYQILSDADPHYQQARTPEVVFRKTKPIDVAQIGPGEFAWSLGHTLYLDLPYDLQPGVTYEIQWSGQDLGLDLENSESCYGHNHPNNYPNYTNNHPNYLNNHPNYPNNHPNHPNTLTFTHHPHQNTSEAIHVSQVGFRPDDPVKVGFLSTWMGQGEGVEYSEGLDFWLMTQGSDRPIYQGKTQISQTYPTPEDPYRNHSGTDVYWMDFSEVQQSGTYRLCVATIGCSQLFKISPQAWQDAFYISARGLYHQRSGIALKQPYTDFQRPRPFHPTDSIQVYQAEVKLMDTHEGLNLKGLSSFETLMQTRTEEVLPQAWGGYFDAGDWDRRIQHLQVARVLLELAQLFPAYGAQLSLNIPESDNQLPDWVDEALWGLDFFRRLQTPSGGIRGGIESAGSPRFGEGSWQESQQVMAYGPDLWSSYVYAGGLPKPPIG
jgi:endoglucanase